MKKLVGYLRKYRKECVLGPLFKLLEACLELIVPLVMAKIIDTGVVNNAGSGYIWRMGALLAGMGLAGLAFSITAQYFAAKAACGFGAELRHALFERTQRLSRSQIKTMGAPTLIQRMTGDVNQVQSGLNLALRLLLRSPFVVMGAMIMAFVVDARCALIFLAVIP
ncbi:MAG: ABC transporter transmembrane domain-containing protein, partial [Eubacteriales bacterium]|nr:ABC transporter transmembrane domain-containing protein [Eubacteriales bacterium]